MKTGKPISAKDLKEWLANIPDETMLVINGTIPTGFKLLNGKVTDGYFGPVFKENKKGDPTVRFQGFTFTHWIESAKEVHETHYW
jgi:hypothetical protein